MPRNIINNFRQSMGVALIRFITARQFMKNHGCQINLGTCMVPCRVLFYISLILDSEKDKHTTMINMKFSTREFFSNYKQMYLKVHSDCH